VRIKPGLLFVDPTGEHWLTCRRFRQEADLQLVNLHTGELRPYLDVEGISFVSLSLDTLLRILPADDHH
jgi:hypothetical protein